MGQAKIMKQKCDKMVTKVENKSPVSTLNFIFYVCTFRKIEYQFSTMVLDWAVAVNVAVQWGRTFFLNLANNELHHRFVMVQCKCIWQWNTIVLEGADMPFLPGVVALIQNVILYFNFPKINPGSPPSPIFYRYKIANFFQNCGPHL